VTFIRIKESFTCEKCGVVTQGNGFTNHCPQCLWSLHVDIQPGDRMAECRSLIRPILVEPAKKGNRVVHECVKCGHRKPNRLAHDDNIETVLRIMGERARKQVMG
jgi:hypothetical protein